jgi:hypothetical protein
MGNIRQFPDFTLSGLSGSSLAGFGLWGLEGGQTPKKAASGSILGIRGACPAKAQGWLGWKGSIKNLAEM